MRTIHCNCILEMHNVFIGGVDWVSSMLEKSINYSTKMSLIGMERITAWVGSSIKYGESHSINSQSITRNILLHKPSIPRQPTLRHRLDTRLRDIIIIARINVCNYIVHTGRFINPNSIWDIDLRRNINVCPYGYQH